MTDVRVVVSRQDLFNKYLEFFTKQDSVIWTVSTSKLWTNLQTSSLLLLLSAVCSKHDMPLQPTWAAEHSIWPVHCSGKQTWPFAWQIVQ